MCLMCFGYRGPEVSEVNEPGFRSRSRLGGLFHGEFQFVIAFREKGRGEWSGGPLS